MGEPVSDSLLGATLAHFKVDARLGAGGMGVVYRAHDTRLNRSVALKVLPPQLSQDPERKALLLKEARAAAAINHPNLAAIYEVGEENGHAFIAMELVQGRSLRQLLSHGALPKELALSIAVQIAQALHRAHSAGLIHRDLKPENVMVGDDGTVKLLDFGLARNTGVSREPSALSGEGVVLGTPGYMAPEQAEGRAVDHRADLFALGATLHEMLSGQPAFKGSTPVERMIASVRDPAAPLERTDLPPEVPSLVSKLLEKDPERRPASVTQVLATLGVQPPVPLPEQVDPFGQTIASPAGRSVKPLLKQSRAPLYAVALVAVAAGVGWLVVRARAPHTPRVLAVADVANQTGDPQLDGLSGMLITALEQSHKLSVLTRGRMIDLLQQHGQSQLDRIDETVGRKLCAEAGADALVLSSVRQLGQSYQLELKVLSPAGDTYLLVESDHASTKEEIPAALERLARRTREGLQMNDEAKPMDVSMATTPNLEAYREYFEAERAVEKTTGSSESDAAIEAQIPKLKHAVELDEGFVQAWILLARFQQFVHDEDGARSSLERAMAHPERASPKDALYLKALGAADQGKLQAADQALDELIAAYPTEKLALYKKGDLYYHHGRLADSIAPLQRAIALDSKFGLAYDHVGVAYADLLRFSELEPFARSYRHNVPGTPADSLLFDALLANHKTAEATALLSPGQPMSVLAWVNLTLDLARNDPQATETIDALDHTGIDWVHREMEKLRATQALARGQPHRAAERFEKLAADQQSSNKERVQLRGGLTEAWSFAGDAEQTIAAAERSNGTADAWERTSSLISVAQLEPEAWADAAPRVDGGKDDEQRALHHLLESADGPDRDQAVEALRSKGVYLAFSARHEVLRGRYADAVEHTRAAAERGLYTSPMWATTWIVDRAALTFWRARALEGLGRKEEAKALYAQLLDGWKEAEPGLPLKIEAEAGLQRVSGEVPEVQNVPH